ncbi:unnamed protein product [Linum tenue]|nr:unnamed protein product [Linum tenue]
MIGKLGDDLLVEILVRSFPDPKSAFRCKAVCKRWSSLILSPCFNRRMISHHQNVKLHPKELQSAILSLLPPMPSRVGGSLKVLDCYKDLVLCGFWDVNQDNGEHSRSYLICNPFTKQWVALPLAPRKLDGYLSPVTRLVCEPVISNKLDLGDDQSIIYSEYRCRVVCIYQDVEPLCLNLDVFCSESGEWIKDALVLDKYVRIGAKCVSVCSGEFFWMHAKVCRETAANPVKLVAGFNPFRLDIPPACIDTSTFESEDMWAISSSQGALHVISNQTNIDPRRVIVWRLEEDRKSRRKQYEGLVKNPRCCSYEATEESFRPFLHPHKPEIVFFQCGACGSTLWSCDLRREELELYAQVEEVDGSHSYAKVFEPRFSCWPTPIPRYTELRGMYNGSYSFWAQGSSEARSPSLDNW